MTITTTSSNSGRRVSLLVGLAVVVAVAVVIVLILVLRSGGSASNSVPALTAAEQQAGAVRVTYPDRSLPDQPKVVIVDGQRVSLFFQQTSGSGDTASATLGVSTPTSDPGSPPTTVTLAKGQTKVVDGYAITLLEAFHTDDVSVDAADVTVAKAGVNQGQ